MAENQSANAKRNDGGPAFPVHGGAHPEHDDPRNHTLGGGMTLRDWFAAQAMTMAFPNGFPAHPSYSDAAQNAYAFADAMLAERSK